ncbi:MAG: hypothetical protein ACFE0Q_13695 [Anaerolineae bacterium]
MITYKKRKNSDKWYLPYLNILVLVLIMGVFATLNVKVSDDVTPVVEDTSVSEALPPVDISGEWVGTITEDYNTEVRYDYRVIFDQYQSEIVGFSFQESLNYTVDIYAESGIVGEVDGYSVYFYEEATHVLDNISMDNWCRIEVRLNYQVIDGQETLIGTWDSAEEERTGCITIDGRILLTRQP